jgi:hypothetical protein
LGKSEHMAILVELDIQVEEATIRQNSLNWRKARLEKIQEEVSNENWEENLREKTTEEAWKDFKARIEEIVDRHKPRFVIVRKRRPDQITQEMVRQIRKKKRLWTVYKRQGDAESTRKYKEQEKVVTKTVRNAKEDGEEVGK